jgi:signal transduction histidine kinase
MNRLVDQMLDTARLDENRIDLDWSPVNLGQVIEEAMRSLEPLATSEHALRLTLPGSPIVVLGDASRLTTVVRNLVENGVKYSPEGGAITITMAVSSGVAAIDITDQGIGIAESDLPRLFTRFGRVVNEQNSHIPGTGLGLYISREIARRHGGDISIASQPGVGTTATLTLPVAQLSADTVVGRPAGAPGAENQTLTTS